MSKRFFLPLLLIIGLCGMLSAQDAPIDSTMSDTTFELYKNPLDGAAWVYEEGHGPGFSELNNTYLFGGLTNLNNADNDATFNAAAGDGLTFGLFKAGAFKWSAFTSLFHDDAAKKDKKDVTTSESSKVVTTTTHRWVDQETTTEYNRVISDEIEDSVQFLTRLGNINTGARLTLEVDNDYDTDNDFKKTDEFFYDTAAAGVAPSPSTDYTIDYEFKDYSTASGKLRTFKVELPVFLDSGGGMSHYGKLGFGITNRDLSETGSLEFSTPKDSTTVDNTDFNTLNGFLTNPGPAIAANFYTNIEEYENLQKVREIPVELDYTLTLPGLFGNHPENDFYVGLDSTFTFNSAEASSSELWQQYNFTAPGATATKSTRGEYTNEPKLEGVTTFDANILAGHRFYYDFANVTRFAIGPELKLTFAKTSGYTFFGTFIPQPYTFKEEEEVTKTDNNNDGDFNDNGDVITTITRTYENSTAVSGATADQTVRNQLAMEFTFPTALVIRPEKWSFGVTLGSKPTVSFIRNKYTTKESVNETETKTEIIGTGTTTVTTNADEADETVETEVLWTAQAEHKIALNLYLPADITIDVALDLSTGTNILEFRDLVVQAIVPLP